MSVSLSIMLSEFSVISGSCNGQVIQFNGCLQFTLIYHAVDNGLINANEPGFSLLGLSFGPNLSPNLYKVIIKLLFIQIPGKVIHRHSLGNGIANQGYAGIVFHKQTIIQVNFIHSDKLQYAVNLSRIGKMPAFVAESPCISQWGNGDIKPVARLLPYLAGSPEHCPED